MTVGDIDGDGLQDLVFGSISWRKNLGGGQFSESYWAGSFVGVHYLRVIDMDQDGDGDIVGSRGHLRVAENLGPDGEGYWQFEDHEIATGFGDATVPWVGDFDGDLDMDIVCGSGSSYPDGQERISWWQNSGQWRFTERVLAENVGDVSYLTVVDVGKDGHLDLLSITSRGESITYWERSPEADPEPPGDVAALSAVGPEQEQRIELRWVDPPDADLCKILLVRSDSEGIPDPRRE